MASSTTLLLRRRRDFECDVAYFSLSLSVLMYRELRSDRNDLLGKPPLLTTALSEYFSDSPIVHYTHRCLRETYVFVLLTVTGCENKTYREFSKERARFS